MPNGTCPTVRVAADNEQGFIVVNESDVTPDTVLFDDKETVAAAPAQAPAPKTAKAKDQTQEPVQDSVVKGTPFTPPFAPAVEAPKMPWQQ